MNLNNWPLEEMLRLEFTVPYPVEECVRRIKGLDEKQRPYFRTIFNTPVEDYFRFFRTAVIQNPDYLGHLLYCVGRVSLRQGYFLQHTYAEVNVMMVPQEGGTRITIFHTYRWLFAQKLWVGLTMLSTLLVPIGALALVNRPGIDAGSVLCLVFIWMIGGTAITAVAKSKYFGQHDILLTQIHKAFGVVYDPM